MYQIGSLEMWKGDFSHSENSSQLTGGPLSHPLNMFMSNNFKNVSPNDKKLLRGWEHLPAGVGPGAGLRPLWMLVQVRAIMPNLVCPVPRLWAVHLSAYMNSAEFPKIS